jgi:hypothetical protein
MKFEAEKTEEFSPHSTRSGSATKTHSNIYPVLPGRWSSGAYLCYAFSLRASELPHLTADNVRTNQKETTIHLRSPKNMIDIVSRHPVGMENQAADVLSRNEFGSIQATSTGENN